MVTPVPVDVSINGAATTLNTLGLWAVIGFGATLFVAKLLYKQFRR